MILAKSLLNRLLPATPVTPSMDEQIREIAKRSNVSVAHVQRAAFEFFLASHVSKTNTDDNKMKGDDRAPQIAS